jgi:UDP-glucose 4-epimerase
VNILLTGGTGYIGSHTAVVLVEAGHKVVLFDNLSNSSRDVVDRLKTITQQDIPFVEGDVRDTSLVSKTIRAYQIDAVIHFAGLKAVGESVEKPLEYFDNNVGGTISLLEAMQENQIKTLVFSSSATVYGEPQYLPIDEDHPTSATNPYGRSKLHIEEMLHDVACSDEDWRIACLRYFNPAGAHQSGLIGENPAGIPNNLMPFVAQVAVGKLECLNIYGDDYETPDGTGVRDYIHVMDLASGHLCAINFLNHNSGCHFFNLGTGAGFSVLDMVKAFERASGRQIKHQITTRRAGDVASCYAHVGKAKRDLGWEASFDLNDMCESGWLWQVKL